MPEIHRKDIQAGVKMTSDKLQQAYELAVKDIGEVCARECKVSEIMYESPVKDWTESFNVRAHEYKAYKFNDNAIIAVSKSDHLHLGVFIKRKMPDFRIKDEFGLKYVDSKNEDINKIWDEIVPKRIELAPLINNLENTVFYEKIIKKEKFKNICLSNDWWLAGYKEIDFNSSYDVVQEIKKVPKVLNEYFLWATII